MDSSTTKCEAKFDTSVTQALVPKGKVYMKTFEHNAFISGNPFTKARLLAQSNLNYSKNESEAF